MSSPQPCILRDVPTHARAFVLDLRSGIDPRPALAALAPQWDPEATVVGFGAPLAAALGREVPGLRAFPALAHGAVTVPSTQGALFVLLHGPDRGVLDDRARALVAALGDAFTVGDDTECFRYREGRDLSGYVDGTENPKAEAAIQAALRPDGSTFVAVQRWVHDLSWFGARTPGERDAIMGRRLADDTEIADAPATAHVKRTAQESYEPPAFMVRRSMPWITREAKGLLFLAYGESLDRYERVLRRMVGLEDGASDGLFRFSRPVTGSYFHCPPLVDGTIRL
jgi:putative iron-dependent peroxidase